MNPKRVVVGISGASGAIYGTRALELLSAMDDIETHLVVTPSARQTLSIECDMTVDELQEQADFTHGPRDVAASIASGSFESSGMIIAPCSIKTLSGVANSYSADLIVRAADVMLKERRPLVLMVRETPFHLGHIRLMERVTEMGAIVQPPVPAFYNRPTTIDEIVTHSVARALEHLDLEVPGIARWSGPG